MKELPQFLESLNRRPSRALFLTYDFSASYFDQDIFPLILNESLTDVMILFDAISQRDSATELGGVRRAGVYYNIASVRPRFGPGLFHPKLVLLEHEGGVDVLIGSANLTWSGWCRNVEIMNALSFGVHGTSDLVAARQLADFLTSLPQALIGIASDADTTLRAAAAALLSAASITPEGDRVNDCAVLFNLQKSLVSQVESIVRPETVSRLTGLSPFFDKENAAVHKLSSVYSTSKVEIIKDGLRQNDFNGPAFTTIGKRASLRQTSWDSSPRPLHAKAVFFEGSADSWLLSGSANLTAPAWLSSTTNGGNIELVTLRHAVGGPRSASVAEISARTLLVELPTSAVDDTDSIVFEVADLAEVTSEPFLHVLSARECDYQLSIEWQLREAVATSDTVNILLRSQDREVLASLTCHETATGWRLNFEPVTSDWFELLDDEIAIAVRLEQQSEVGTLTGSSWLRREGLLGQSPGTLLLRHRLRALSNYSSNDPEALLLGIAALLQAAQSDESAFEIDGSAEGVEPIVDGETIQVASALRQPIREIIKPYFPPAVPISRKHAPKRTRTESLEDSDANDQAIDDIDPTPIPDLASSRLERAQGIADSLRSLKDVLTGYVTRSLASPDNDRLARSTAGALLTGIHAASLALRQQWLDQAAIENDSRLEEPFAAIAHARQTLWRLAFSIEGWETGHCPGWFPRISLSFGGRQITSTVLGQPATRARIFIDVLTTAIRESTSVVASESLFVLQWLVKVSYPVDEELQQQMLRLLEREHFVEEASPLSLARSFERAIQLDDLHGWDQLREWIPIVEFLDGRMDADIATVELSDRLAKSLGSILRRPDARKRFSGITMIGGHHFCSGCQSMIPPLRVQVLLKSKDVIVHCESCSVVLMPIDPHAPLVRAMMDSDAQSRFSKSAGTRA